jgi:hypothetical protein
MTEKMKKNPPIGCGTHHFPRLIGTKWICFYCNKDVT